MAKSAGKMIFAGVIGALAGIVGGVLFAPKSGKETRADIAKVAAEISKQIKSSAEDTEARVKEVFGSSGKAATAKYKEIRNTVVGKVAALKTAGDEIDKEKYSMIVDDVVTEFKNDIEMAKGSATKMASQMKKDWEKIKKAIA